MSNNLSYFDKGVAFFQQDEFDKARIEFKNAIQQNPQMAEAHFYMALLNEKTGKFKAMKINLIEAMKFDPENIKVKLKLSKVNLLFNETDKSLQGIEDVLKINPDHLEALTLKASVFLRQKKTDEALAIIERVLEKDAVNIEALSLKVLVFVKKKAFDEALVILEPALKKEKDNVSLHLLKVQIDSKKNDIDAVIADYKKLIELKPDNTQIKNILAQVYLKANKKKEAESLLRSMVTNAPEALDLKIQLLNFLYSDDRVKGLSQLDSFSEESKNKPLVLIAFSEWLIAKNEISKARALLSKILTMAPNNEKNKHNVKLILAKLDYSKRDYKSALSQVGEILAENSENLEAKLFKAKLLIIGESYPAAIKIIENIIWQDPRMDKAHSLLGTVNENRGDIDKAYANYKEALAINPKNLVALDFIVKKEVANGHTDYAIELLERALYYQPSQLAILTKLAELNIYEKNWDKANSYIKVIEATRGGRLLSELFKGKILQGENEYSDAVLVYKDILKDAPWVKEALTGMAESYAELNEVSKMDQYLDGFIEKNPEIYYPYILKSRLLSAEGKKSKAIKLIKQALEKNIGKEPELYIELARLYKLTGNKEKRFKAYIQGLKDHPDDVSLMLNLAAYFESYHEYDSAIKQYRHVLHINSKQRVARNNLAVILLDQYQSEEHLNEALALVNVFKQSKQAYFLDTYGWAYFKKGDLDTALSTFKKVVLLEPNIPVFRYHLAEAYFKLNNAMAASSELKQALRYAKNTVFPEKKKAEELLKKVKGK